MGASHAFLFGMLFGAGILAVAYEVQQRANMRMLAALRNAPATHGETK